MCACVHVSVHVYDSTEAIVWYSEKQFAGVSPPPLLCGFWVSKSGCQAQQQVPLSTQLSYLAKSRTIINLFIIFFACPTMHYRLKLV